MTENKLLPYNEIPILPIRHNFFNISDDETIRSDSEIYENKNLETVFTFNNESLLYANKLTEEKEELIDNELFENFSDIDGDDKTLENLSDNNESIINLESNLVEATEPLILFKNNNTPKH
ncbi:hypothetical protein Glove_320g134 [Diversispora epigaea]|uniref:Uncharacterized protein n=1 Tax=Diversispora epigaea TaxID=1348612 RepID=A0A397HTB7_9GLOM|nr:hypothetical protein Glove_320g134 [Diversispora epigaea]